MKLRAVRAASTGQIMHRQQRCIRALPYLVQKLLSRLEIEIDSRLGDLLPFGDHAALRLPPLGFGQVVGDDIR